MNILNIIKNFVSFILFPSKCIGCGNFVTSALCKNCTEAIQSKFTPTIIQISNTNLKCVSCFAYEGKVKDIIYEFKFKHQKNALIILSQFLIIAIYKKLNLYKFDTITYVPVYNFTKGKLYNQSEILAKNISQNLNIPLKSCLVKIKNNKKQHKLSFHERQENVKGVYSSTGNLENKNIILCDDIITTGATLLECAKELSKSGANVTCVTLAYTVLDKTRKRKNE